MTKTAVQILEEHAIKPSVQRIEVVKYLLQNRIHPTADDIFSALQPEMPTLSRTTIYNVLRVLVDGGVVRELYIDDRNVRYDIMVKPHAHFRCRRCGKIIDLPMPELSNVDCQLSIDEVEVYYYGICEDCKRMLP